jgi:hypothetical protein
MRGLGGVNMDNNHQIQIIESKILSIRGQQVMLDRDLAALYQVETKVLNQAVKRNLDKFPDRYYFQLTNDEWESLRSQSVTSKNKRGGRTYIPYVFSRNGCLQASNVLNSPISNEMSIFIIDAFVALTLNYQHPNYELLREQILRLQSDTKLINAEMLALKKDHKIDLNVQNMEINDLNEKVTELLTEFNKFRDSSIIIKKDDGIGEG